jgi:hypothetical protein
LATVLTKVARVDMSKVFMVSVSEVFEVMAQVGHDLTTVSRFDQQLRLIKNLGRHKGSVKPPPGQAGITVLSRNLP